MTFLNAVSPLNTPVRFPNRSAYYPYSTAENPLPNSWPTVETGAELGIVYSVAKSLLSMAASGLSPITRRKVTKIALEKGWDVAKVSLASGLSDVIHKSLLGGFLGYAFYQLQKSSCSANNAST